MCKHLFLKFTEGGLFIQCEDCGQKYVKSLKGADFCVDFYGKFDGFTENDRRNDPFSIPKK